MKNLKKSGTTEKDEFENARRDQIAHFPLHKVIGRFVGTRSASPLTVGAFMEFGKHNDVQVREVVIK